MALPAATPAFALLGNNGGGDIGSDTVPRDTVDPGEPDIERVPGRAPPWVRKEKAAPGSITFTEILSRASVRDRSDDHGQLECIKHPERCESRDLSTPTREGR